MVTSTRNVVFTWNQLQATTGNLLRGRANDLALDEIDFESASARMGHALGLAHPNLASESGLNGNNQDYTR